MIAAIDQDLALQIIAGMVLSELDVKVAKAISEKMAEKSENPNK
ncbi:MAG: hypothetical protein QF434_10400 [Nitrospinaceae bacterium]|nr:hypothetical protein [Nitrospinaceae bacterium]